MKMREGFWWSEYHPELPKPKPRKKPWKGKKKFLQALEDKEQEAAQRLFKGWSNCRVCGSRNGSCEYELEGWIWPSGFRHYVEEHNVRPSLAFQEFVVGYYVEGRR